MKEMTANVDWQESERDARVAEYKLQEAKEVEEEGTESSHDLFVL